ncbi:helix-turn-helix domain-containing protein [Thermanaeromonas toyohensis]
MARLESGRYNPSLRFLKRVAKALDVKLEVKLRPQ